MKHFKHLKPGMSLVEVIAAIGVLAIFGSSIFMMQQFLFDRMMISQKKFFASLHIQSELAVYQKNILEEYFEQKGPVEKSLQEHTKDFTHPDMTVTITTTSDLATDVDQKESPFKKFKNLHLITSHAALHEADYGASYFFVYIPEVAKK